MARNEEKAMAMLNRWVKMKRDLNTTKKPEKKGIKRPEDPKECANMQEAEVWRQQIVREVIRKVSEIQNGSLGEYKIRELNDSINELLKDKARWETHISSLGGRDYQQDQEETIDGAEAFTGVDGYKYFGAARNLPKVREIFSKEEIVPAKTNIKDLYKKVDHFYLGLMDPDQSLEELEAQAEARLRSQDVAAALQENFMTKKRRRIELMQTQEKTVKLSKMSIDQFKDLFTTEQMDSQDGEEASLDRVQVPQEKPNHVLATIQSKLTTGPVPTSAEELLQKLKEKKQRLLMEKYASDDLAKSQQESKQLSHLK